MELQARKEGRHRRAPNGQDIPASDRFQASNEIKQGSQELNLHDGIIVVLGFSRMRSEGFPFIVGGVGVGHVFAWPASCRRLSSSLVVSRRLSSSVVVSRRRRVSNLLPLGEAFASDFAWTCHVSVCAANPL